MEEMGQGTPPALGLLGAPSRSYALCPEESEDTADTGPGPRRVCHPCAHSLSSSAGPGGLASLGYSPGTRFSMRLISRGGAQRLPRATASQSARLAYAEVQGVDGAA